MSGVELFIELPAAACIGFMIAGITRAALNNVIGVLLSITFLSKKQGKIEKFSKIKNECNEKILDYENKIRSMLDEINNKESRYKSL